MISVLWLAIQGLVGFLGFYKITDTTPPRFVLLIGPAFLFIILLFLTNKGRSYLDSLNYEWLTWLHMIRIPVEIVLFWLFLDRMLPESMTFEGRNLDIISGITAPFIAFFGFRRQYIGRAGLIAWNLLCLGLVLNVLTYGILSAPSPFQQLSFNQPNIAILYFPFVWLAGFIVPVVLLAHLSSLRMLILKRQASMVPLLNN